MEWADAERNAMRIVRDVLSIPEIRSILLSDRLETELSADSLDQITIILEIEKELGVDIPIKESPPESLHTVRDVAHVFLVYG